MTNNVPIKLSANNAEGWVFRDAPAHIISDAWAATRPWEAWLGDGQPPANLMPERNGVPAGHFKNTGWMLTHRPTGLAAGYRRTLIQVRTYAASLDAAAAKSGLTFATRDKRRLARLGKIATRSRAIEEGVRSDELHK